MTTMQMKRCFNVPLFGRSVKTTARTTPPFPHTYGGARNEDADRNLSASHVNKSTRERWNVNPTCWFLLRDLCKSRRLLSSKEDARSPGTFMTGRIRRGFCQLLSRQCRSCVAISSYIWLLGLWRLGQQFLSPIGSRERGAPSYDPTDRMFSVSQLHKGPLSRLCVFFFFPQPFLFHNHGHFRSAHPCHLCVLYFKAHFSIPIRQKHKLHV
ncbi:uncharacterized protein LOC128765681 isoform X2 [Synchiropus splendidus]|uniref:uncharacterized protein LOC128765681 isoform X2 n=1 Tax=Synchiropus splendidus TaxID=270530 RepID=UPI00237E3A33|nr:uncharacterized protein LOC128765681 isoform X2 [Synchiropus splendidus]